MLSCNPSCLSWPTKSQGCVCTAAIHYHMKVVCLLSGSNRSCRHKYVTQGVCCDLLTKEEKTKTWLTDGFYLRCGKYSEVDSWSITSKKNSNEGNLHGGQNFGQCTWLYWEKHWPYVWLYIDSSAIMGGWLRICKEHDWENDEKDTLESGMWTDHLKWTKDVKVCMSYINAH